MNELATYAQQAVIPSAIALVAIATYTDCRWRFIKNILTVPAIALGLLLHFLGSGWPGLTSSFLGLAAGFGLMMIPFAFGQMGGGDVKLMAALGTLLGAYAIVNVFLYTTLAGGLLAMGFALYHKEGFNTLRRTWHLAKGLFIYRTPPIMQTTPEHAVTMPYGLAIAAGTLTYLILGNVV
jgi:prepilin peptidase CpaA